MDINDLTIGQAKEIASFFPHSVVTNMGIGLAQHPMIGKHCVVRTYTDGVHIGTVSAVDGMEVLLKNARRLWQWKGAFTLSEVAVSGIQSDSRVAIEVPEIYLTQVISFTPTTKKAQKTYDKCVEK